jgi:DNA-binding phage protein
MDINKKHFPKVMQDNDEIFLAHLEGVISSVDELCSLEITKNTDSYRFRIAASLPKYNNMLIEEILKFCNMFKIRVEMSKSITTSSVITFEIDLDVSQI